MIPVALLRSSHLPHAKPGSSGFYYFVEYWLYHASNVSTETHETNTPSELSVAAMGFFSDHGSFQSWATTVSGDHINGRYVVPKSQPLHIAATYGLLGIARLLANGGADVSVADSLGSTPLFYASYWGFERVAQLLIDKGADVSVFNSEGETPLHQASCKGNEGVARLLISRGADVSAFNNEGETPLHRASSKGNEGVARLLIDRGADISVTNKDGETPLHQASSKGNEGVAQLLIDQGADISVTNNEGETPLHQASCKGNEGVARLLINRGAGISVTNKEGETPLHQACCGDNEGVILLLIGGGADISAVNNKGETPLHHASSKGNEWLVRLLIDEGASVSAFNNKGETPLYQASCGGHERVVQLLIDEGADISASDSVGRTPLFQAPLLGRKGAVQLLVDKGTDTQAKDKKEQGALHSPDASEQASGADISGSDTDTSGSGSILSAIESVFSIFSSQSSATSISQVPPEARDQAEDAIAHVLAKATAVSVIVTKGVGKLGQRSVERLMAKALKQFSISTKQSLDKDKMLLRECFTFIEIRAISIARKIRELTQSKSPAAPEQTAIKKYFEDTHSHKVPFSERIDSWQDSRPDKPDGPLPFHGPQNTSGEELDELSEEEDFEYLSESNEIKPSHDPGELGVLNEGRRVEEPGENLLQQITEYLESDKIANDFLCAVKNNFLKVQLFTLCWRGKNKLTLKQTGK